MPEKDDASIAKPFEDGPAPNDDFESPEKPGAERITVHDPDADFFVVDGVMRDIVDPAMSIRPGPARFILTKHVSKLIVKNDSDAVYFEFSCVQSFSKEEQYDLIIELDRLHTLIQKIGTTGFHVAIHENGIVVHSPIGVKVPLDFVNTSIFDRFTAPSKEQLLLVAGPIPLIDLGAAFSFIGKHISAMHRPEEVVLQDSQLYVVDKTYNHFCAHDLSTEATLSIFPTDVSKIVSFISGPFAGKTEIPHSSQEIFVYKDTTSSHFLFTYEPIVTTPKVFLQTRICNAEPKTHNLLKLNPKFREAPDLDLVVNRESLVQALQLQSIVSGRNKALKISIKSSSYNTKVRVESETEYGSVGHSEVPCEIAHRDPTLDLSRFKISIDHERVLKDLRDFESNTFHLKSYASAKRFIMLFTDKAKHVLSVYPGSVYLDERSGQTKEKDAQENETEAGN